MGKKRETKVTGFNPSKYSLADSLLIGLDFDATDGKETRRFSLEFDFRVDLEAWDEVLDDVRSTEGGLERADMRWLAFREFCASVAGLDGMPPDAELAAHFGSDPTLRRLAIQAGAAYVLHVNTIFRVRVTGPLPARAS